MLRRLLLCVPFSVTCESHEPLSGKALYDALYAVGYGSEGSMVHYLPILKEIKKLNGVHSVLDVGCSHGGGVEALWEMGIRASGVDISSNAVKMAQRRHGDNDLCVDKCWQSASATSLPFVNSTFDAIISTDVLEHLDPTESDMAVSELVRVTRMWLVLKIANRHEGSRMDRIKAPVGKHQSDTFSKVIRKQHGRDLPANLHTLVQSSDWWITKFEAAGFELFHTVKLAPWACCGFVLHRKAREQTRLQ